MIIGAHSIIYTDHADETRAFIRDVLGFPHVDAGGGWLIFALPPGELGIHPSEHDPASNGRHELYLMCDDVEATVKDLEGKGVEFASPIIDAGFGRLTMIKLPGGSQLGLYQPRHPMAITPPR